MLYRLLIIILLVLAELPVDAATLKGVILANELNGPPMENVGVDAISGTNLTSSDLSGKFTLEFPQRRIGDTVRIIVKKEGYVVVNDVQLETVLPVDADAAPLSVILAKEQDREEMARRFYRLKSSEAIETTYQQKLKVLEDEHRADAAALDNLQKERDQAKASAEKLAEEMAKNQPGQSFELYKQAQRLFLDGKIDAAIALLDNDELRRSAEQAEKTLADAIQGWRLKANLFKLKFRFDEAEKAYEMALRYINRETNPQLWAETEDDVGITHDELGIRVEGKAGNEHLAAAITAYRSALEVYTREQLPQDWAMTQNNLGNALGAQAVRTEGPRGAELLAQAVSAFRSALDVRTREQLPQDWAMTQNNLGITLWNQAVRTEGPRGAELLAQAVSAFRSALEVSTREQLPQDWAGTQNNLGGALWAQAARTEGPKGAELLAQAVAAFHSCLEIYTAEAFPLDHKRAQEQLMECERLLTQAKVQAQKP
jgi:tetratricopeptide (TPR) repeat protein